MSVSLNVKGMGEDEKFRRGLRSVRMGCLLYKFFPRILSFFLVLAWAIAARAATATISDVTSLSLEQLMDIEVTSVAKRPQKLKDAAAAVFVITQEDIRRCGATNIPELLRMVPGVEVARINAHDYAVSIRGFNDRFANKLLVLMDGRTLYSPLFSGVIWSVQDTVLEDIERIEVIRGPGASVWGANAVNGVINIITKKAEKTQGTLVSVGAGTEDKAFATLRYGGTIADKGAYRIYVKAKELDESVDAQAHDGVDDWRAVNGGFRLDWSTDGGNEFTLQGDIYHQRGGVEEVTQSLSPPNYSSYIYHVNDMDTTGGNLLGRWSRRDPSGDGWQLQAFYDYSGFTGSSVLEWSTHILDLEYQQDRAWGSCQHWTWGMGYRFNRTETDGSAGCSFSPEDSDWSVLSAFAQDEITLIRDRLFLTIGSKFEYNQDTGFAVQPNARLLWQLDDRNTLWAAISRALRTPSRSELDILITNASHLPVPAPIPNLVINQILGNEDVKSEGLLAFEIGYRKRISDSLSLDTTAFLNRYDNLVGAPQPIDVSPEFKPVPHLATTTEPENVMDGEVYGVEIEANWDVTGRWKLRGAYTFTEMFLHNKTDQPLIIWGEELEGKAPRHMMSLRSQWTLPKDVEFDVWLRYVDDLSALDIPAYVTADLRLSWRARPNLELSLVGQNLFDPQHPEYEQSAILPAEADQVERSFYGKITWRF